MKVCRLHPFSHLATLYETSLFPYFSGNSFGTSPSILSFAMQIYYSKESNSINNGVESKIYILITPEKFYTSIHVSKIIKAYGIPVRSLATRKDPRVTEYACCLYIETQEFAPRHTQTINFQMKPDRA